MLKFWIFTVRLIQAVEMGRVDMTANMLLGTYFTGQIGVRNDNSTSYQLLLRHDK